MAVIVKGEITITKGFDHWKSMVFSQKEKMAGMGMQFLDSPATTNQVTYKVQVTMEGNNQLVINRSITHADSTSVYVALSTLTAMEVAQ